MPRKKKPAAPPPPPPPPAHRVLPGPAEVAAKLRELAGNQAAVARHYGVTRQAVSKMVGDHPELRDACHDAREAMKDNAESALHRAILAGEAWAVCFYLKTQAKDRGYVERQEIETRNRTTLEIVEEIVDAPPEDGPAAPGPGGVPAV